LLRSRGIEEGRKGDEASQNGGGKEEGEGRFHIEKSSGKLITRNRLIVYLLRGAFLIEEEGRKGTRKEKG